LTILQEAHMRRTLLRTFIFFFSYGRGRRACDARPGM